MAGSVTDSQMGEDYITSELVAPAGNAKRDGARLSDAASVPLCGVNGVARSLSSDFRPGELDRALQR